MLMTRSVRGFTLLEILIAMLILSFGLLGLAALQAYSVKANQSANFRSQATALANMIMDNVRSNRGNLGEYYSNSYVEVACTAVPSDASPAATDLDTWRQQIACQLPQGRGAVAPISETKSPSVSAGATHAGKAIPVRRAEVASPMPNHSVRASRTVAGAEPMVSSVFSSSRAACESRPTDEHAKTDSRVQCRSSKGVSLIELMVAITIASLLTLGLIQIFGATRVSTQMQEGLSRVQENGRFATQFLQRQLRMVGFMGCGADTGRFTQETFTNHFMTYPNVLAEERFRFERPIEAYTAGGTPPADLVDGGTFVAGSDVLILRVLSEESVPVVSISKAGQTLSALVGTPDAAFLPEPNQPAVLAMQNCRTAACSPAR